jgi:hypothetical protein
MKVFDFAYHGYLQALKVRDLKTFTICLSQLFGLKDWKIQVGF